VSLQTLATAICSACDESSCKLSTACRTDHWKHCKAREPRSTAGSVLGVELGAPPQGSAAAATSRAYAVVRAVETRCVARC